MACYSDGRWTPVTHLPGAGSGAWTSIGYSLRSGGIKQIRVEWSWYFGELPPGRYMYIRGGSLGEWSKDTVYALVEFYITADSPISLPPQSDEEPPHFIDLVEYGNVTPGGMMVVIENVSEYDLDHSAQIMAIVLERDAFTDPWYVWKKLPTLRIEGDLSDYLSQGKGFLPSGGRLEFQLDWTAAYGELPPDDYKVVLSSGGYAYPSYPSERAPGDIIVISFTV